MWPLFLQLHVVNNLIPSVCLPVLESVGKLLLFTLAATRLAYSKDVETPIPDWHCRTKDTDNFMLLRPAGNGCSHWCLSPFEKS